jgi:hypothetical protein
MAMVVAIQFRNIGYWVNKIRSSMNRQSLQKISGGDTS